MIQKKYTFTPEGFAKLRAELEHLRTTRRRELAEKMQRSREDNRLAETAEYDDALNEKILVEKRIQLLEQTIEQAVISAPNKNNPAVEFGDRVTVRNQEDRKEVFTIVGSAEANPGQGRISNESPVSRGLLGKKVGDNVEIKVPTGVVKFTIIRIG